MGLRLRVDGLSLPLRGAHHSGSVHVVIVDRGEGELPRRLQVQASLAELLEASEALGALPMDDGHPCGLLCSVRHTLSVLVRCIEAQVR